MKVLNTKEKLAQYYDSFGQDTPRYWKIFWYSHYHMHAQVCQEIISNTCSEFYDTRCEEQGLQRNDWENWNYVAVKVSIHIGLPTLKL